MACAYLFPEPMRTPGATTTASEERTAFGWVDAVVLLAIFGQLWSVLHFGRGMLVYFDESQMLQLSTNLSDIPYAAGRTVLRMRVHDRLEVAGL
jgi:NitT/TauT family transport system permease protein